MPTAQLRLIKQHTPTTELEVAIEQWVIDLEADDLADRTITGRRWYVCRLAVWLRGRGCVSPGQVDEATLKEWTVSIKRESDWAASTRAKAIDAVRRFFAWCVRTGQLLDDPAVDLRMPKVKSKPQRTIDRAELDRLLISCLDTDRGRRDGAIMSLLYDSGLRSAELCRLRLADLNLEERELYVRIKGGDTAAGWFGERCEAYLRDWLSVRDQYAGLSERSVFVSFRGRTAGKALTGSGLRQILRGRGQRAGLDGVSPHAFRRGFAVALSAAGISDNVLKDLGRWRDVKMIRQYTLAQRVKPLYRSPLDLED